MNKLQAVARLTILCLALTLLAFSAPQDARAQVDPTADRLLMAMGQFLGSLEQFSFTANVRYDENYGDGQMVEFGGTLEVSAARPNRLRADFSGDERTSQLVYNGETVTVWGDELNVFATTPAPDNIGDAIDMVFENYGYSVPAADFVYPDPYAVLIENVDTGIYVGRHDINGVSCHHLAFTQYSVDWEIWIEDGPNPVPCRIVIFYKDEPGVPRYEATLDWNLTTLSFSNGFFEFVPPEGSTAMDFIPTSPGGNGR